MAKVRFRPARLCLLAGLLVVAATIGVVTRTPAVIIAGGTQRNDCYSEFEIMDAEMVVARGGPKVKCIDGDPCDKDGMCGNRACTFNVRLCINQHDPSLPSCPQPPAGLTHLQVIPPRCQLPLKNGLILRDSMCAPLFTPVTVRVPKTSKTRPGRLQLRAVARAARAAGVPTTDSDQVNLFCYKRTTPCPTTTTTTLTATSVTTTTVTTTSTTIAGCDNLVH